MIEIIRQTYGNSIQSRRKFRVQPLAGESENNVIRNGPLVNFESLPTQLRTLDLMWLSSPLATVRPTSHLLVSFYLKNLSHREMRRVCGLSKQY